MKSKNCCRPAWLSASAALQAKSVRNVSPRHGLITASGKQDTICSDGLTCRKSSVHGQSDAIGHIISHADECELHLHNCEAWVRKLRADILRVHRQVPKGLTFGLMHCGKSTHRDLVEHVLCHAPYRDSLHCDKVRESSAALASDCGGFQARVTVAKSQQRLRALGNWNSGGRGTPYGATYTHFAIVSRGASVSKSRRYGEHNIRRAVASFWSFVC
jgi:hypothetical protein